MPRLNKQEREGAVDERGGGVQVIARAASILNALGNHPDGMSLGEIAHQVDLPRSTVQRLVNALEEAALVRSEGAGGIGLGGGLLRLVSAAHTDLASLTRPWLRKLSDATQETVVLSRASRLQLVIEHRIVADRELQVIPRLGLINMPLYSSAAGLALLALSSDEEVREMLRANQDLTYGFPPPDVPVLLLRLDEARNRHFACDHDSAMQGFTTLAVALDSLLGRFSVSLPIPTIRFEKQQDLYFAELMKCKEGLMREIGT